VLYDALKLVKILAAGLPAEILRDWGFIRNCSGVSSRDGLPVFAANGSTETTALLTPKMFSAVSAHVFPQPDFLSQRILQDPPPIQL